MKAKLLREMPCKVTDDVPPEHRVKVPGVITKKVGNSVQRRRGLVERGRRPAGHVIDHPDAWKLVRMGVAEPADAECAEAAGMTADEIAGKAAIYEMFSRGIRTEDYQAYQDGEMIGYQEDGVGPRGDWTPGPNYVAPVEDEDEDEDDEA